MIIHCIGLIENLDRGSLKIERVGGNWIIIVDSFIVVDPLEFYIF